MTTPLHAADAALSGRPDGSEDAARLSRTVAAVQEAGTAGDRLPPHVREQVLSSARREFDRQRADRRSSPVAAAAGWLLAATLAAAWLLSLTTSDAPVGGFDRERAVAIEWTPTEDPAAAGASGVVLWDADAQAGEMRFAGLAANDPSESQYQLWIFDAARDERYPVDGGVFDVRAGGTTVVPIRPSVPVSEATLFAVTIERPGGVVVSDRSRLPLTAAVPSA